MGTVSSLIENVLNCETFSQFYIYYSINYLEVKIKI